MDAKRFKHLWSNPSEVREEEIAELRIICVNTPFFAAGQMLYAKVLHERADYQFNKQLKWAALYCPSREVLHNFIHCVPKAIEKPALDFDPSSVKADGGIAAPLGNIHHSEPNLSEKMEPEPAKVPEAAKPETNTSSKTKPVEPPLSVKPSMPSPTTSAGGNEDWAERIAALKKKSQEVIEKISQNIEPKEANSTDNIASEQRNDVATLNTNIDEESLDGFGSAMKVETKAHKEAIDKTALVSPRIADNSEEKTNILEKNEENEESPAPQITQTPVDFLTWLRQRSANSETAALEVKEEPKKPKEVSIDSVNAKKGEENRKKIDAFLEKLPEIAPPKKSKFDEFKLSPVAFSTGIEEDSDLVTETLARIYIEQGHIDKAIKAYEILMLKMPEKSSLFARQIQSLKKQIKK
jgi:hypothetical protein